MNNKKGKVYRQSVSNRIVHWVTALSIFLLIISGIGQMPVYKRYNVTKLPNAEWLGDYSITLVMHYLGGIALTFIVFYHIFVHFFKKEFDAMPKKGDVKESWHIIKAIITKGKEPASDKYLAEQRLAYLAIGIVILMLVFSGMIKVAKNVGVIYIPDSIIWVSTQMHNVGTFAIIFLVFAHLAAFAIKANRKLLPGMFTGYVDEEYVKERHSIWYEKLTDEQKRMPQSEKSEKPYVQKERTRTAPVASQILSNE